MFWLLYGNTRNNTICPILNRRSYENLVGLEGEGVGVVYATFPNVIWIFWICGEFERYSFYLFNISICRSLVSVLDGQVQWLLWDDNGSVWIGFNCCSGCSERLRTGIKNTSD